MRHVNIHAVVPSGEFHSDAPTAPKGSAVLCPACADEAGASTGDRLVQLESGTWVRQPCEICCGSGRLDGEALARYSAGPVD